MSLSPGLHDPEKKLSLGQQPNQGACTWQRRVVQEGSSGRQNFFMELTAAGKAGAEKMAATRLIRRIQDSISSLLLGTKEDIKGL